jgi:tetratricopeptide (TPR) repeat protein
MTQVPPQPEWRALTDNGAALLRQGQPGQALAVLQRAERLAPAERDVCYWLGNAYRMNGQVRQARTLFGKLLAANPADLDTSFALAFLMRDAGAPADAAEVLRRASRQPAVTLEQLVQMAGFLRESNQFTTAIEMCEKALEMSPGQVDLHFKLARLYQATGAFDTARDALRTTLDLDASTGPAWIALAQQKPFESADDPDFRRLKAAAARAHGRETDMCIAFAYGKALDDLGRWPEAWAQFRRGNRLMAAATPWRADTWTHFVDRTVAGAPQAASPANGPARNAVFIVGMPRSGTTLLEQMLDRHPRITGRGELNFLSEFAVQASAAGSLSPRLRREMGDALWTQLRLQGPEQGFYIDKNPLNFRHLGLLFELLPTARVLHVTRDGRASCMSCYFQLFKHQDTAFSYGLERLATFYAGYRRLMAHWETLYPDRILRVDYAALTGSSREVLAGALRHLGAGWDEAVLGTGGQHRVVRTASVWQARQPIHTRSVDRWRHYAEQAPGFFARLAEIDAAYAAEAG